MNRIRNGGPDGRYWLALVAALVAQGPGCVQLKDGNDRQALATADARVPSDTMDDAAAEDPPVPVDASSEGGSDSGPAVRMTCGDGNVSAGETCDTALDPSEPGACPTECPTLGNCIPRALEGTKCQVECVELEPVCTDDDGCCAPGCNNATDDDCSAKCGDGVVQASEHETCEPGHTPCPTQADCEAEDDDPCTIDRLVGEAENCNAACTHDLINALTSGDQCCLPDSNANTDTDCKPRCGNDVLEEGESCDGGDGCSDDCMLMRTPEQEACIAEASSSGEAACAICTCTVCTAQMKACRDSGNDARDALCTDVAECANEKSCAGDVCYCGDVDTGTCLLLGGNGPCKGEVEDAARSTDPFQVETERAKPDTALGRARALGDCTVRNCSDACLGD